MLGLGALRISSGAKTCLNYVTSRNIQFLDQAGSQKLGVRNHSTAGHFRLALRPLCPSDICQYRPFFRYFMREEFYSVSAAGLLGAASPANEVAETCPN
jgi:hypothetical protein